MKQAVTVWGVVVRLVGTDPYTHARVTSLRVSSSGDGVKSSDVSDIVITKYSADMLSTSWFKKVVTARYWRINVLTWRSRASIKADLIGEIP